MGVDLRMEPYATMFEKERPESRIMMSICFPDITDKLCDRLGLSRDEFRELADKDGRLPHEAALRLLAAVESHHALAEKAAYLASLLPRLVRESRTCCHVNGGNHSGSCARHGGPNRPPPRPAPLVSAEIATGAADLARKCPRVLRVRRPCRIRKEIVGRHCCARSLLKFARL